MLMGLGQKRLALHKKLSASIAESGTASLSKDKFHQHDPGRFTLQEMTLCYPAVPEIYSFCFSVTCGERVFHQLK